MAVPAGARKSSAGVIVEADWRMMMPIGPPEPPGPPIMCIIQAKSMTEMSTVT